MHFFAIKLFLAILENMSNAFMSLKKKKINLCVGSRCIQEIVIRQLLAMQDFCPSHIPCYS